MAMLSVNGAAIPAPSAMKAAIFDISSGVNRNAKGNAVVDRRAVKRRLELAWAHLEGDALARLLQAMDGFFTVSYPDPESGAGNVLLLQRTIGGNAAHGRRTADLDRRENDLDGEVKAWRNGRN